MGPKKTMITVRLAQRSELTWINSRYDEVAFVHSDFDEEVIAVAEHQDQRAGIGRLVTVDPHNLELGGMYVFDAYRGLGIARKIVTFLLSTSAPGQTIYCLPFADLVPFYCEFGFKLCVNPEQAPSAIWKKYQWGQHQYDQPVSLLVLNG